MALKTHYCVFTQWSFVGSRHDYANFKEKYTTYLPYLVKTAEEFRILEGDQEHQSWAILLDKGYIGPESDTQGLRKLTPLKNPALKADIIEKTRKKFNPSSIRMFFWKIKKAMENSEGYL